VLVSILALTTSSARAEQECSNNAGAVLIADLIATPVCLPLALVHAVFPRSWACKNLEPTTTCREVSAEQHAAEEQSKAQAVGQLLQFNQQLQEQQRAVPPAPVPQRSTTTCHKAEFSNDVECTTTTW
jgi:hypothetical protein